MNLFQIYVAAAAPDAQIIITQIAPDTSGHLNPTPYGGGSAININPNIGTVTAETTDKGAVYIGAETPTGTDPTTGNIPIVYSPSRIGLGVRPAGKGYFAGIQTAPGISLAKVLIGGTVTGIVNIEGNVEEFYAGEILTGDATGLTFGTKTSIPNNFTIGGDLRALLVSGSIGTTDGNSPIYTAGTMIRVRGKLGYLHVGGENDSSVVVENNSSVVGLTTPIQEAEYTLIGNETPESVFLQGLLADTGNSGAFFGNNNNAADLASPSIYTNYQFGNSFTSSTTGVAQTTEFEGTLDGVNKDTTDTYGLPLIAGQTVTLGLNSAGTANLGVFDPLGRLVATDLPDGAGQGADTPFLFTAKTPGVYRLVVALPTDVNFNNTPSVLTTAAYTLTASNIGELALGGMSVAGNALFTTPGIGIAVTNGDLGALESGNEIGAFTTTLDGSDSAFAVARGNLRYLAGDTIGNENAAAIGGEKSNINLSATLTVPRGSVGYLLSNGTMVANPDASDSSGEFDPRQAIGFDYQRVETRTGSLDTSLVANGRIGTIVAASVAQLNDLLQPVYSVNADGKGTDGTIDAIYVSGDFGSTAVGGPAIYTGPGGNVKYLHVGGTTYRDKFFGGTVDSVTEGKLGQPLSFTDDSGARVLITPTTDFTNTTTGTTGTTSTTVRGTISVVSYPVRDKGGSILVEVASGTSLSLASQNTGGSVDIGQIYVGDTTGTAVAYSAGFNQVGYATGTTTGTGTGTGLTVVTAMPPTSVGITMTGAAPINVLNITGEAATTLNGTATPTTTASTFAPILNNVSNTTGGEIASMNLASLGTFTAQSAGFVRSSTAAEVDLPTNLTTATFPFNAYSTGIQVTGSAIAVSVRDGLGNFTAGNAIGTITTNADGKNTKGIVDGIVGAVAGRVIQKVNIGEGIAAGGTGTVVGGGIFGIGSTAEIQNVFGNNADVRGYIASENRIDNITLINGSLLGARVVTPTTIGQAVFNNRQFSIVDSQFNNGQSDAPGGTLVVPPGGVANTLANYSLGTLAITGGGGILGTAFELGNFNLINVQGFGIVSSLLQTTASFSTNNRLISSGLGIRDSTLDFGSGINRIDVVGTGNVLNVNNFSPTARASASKAHFDTAGTGRLLGISNDLNRDLGTSRGDPAVSGVTNSGLLINTTITGNGTINRLNAFLIGSTNTSATVSTTAFPMRISIADGIGKIVTQYISGLQLTTGTLGNLQVAKSTQRTVINSTGSIGNVTVGGNMLGSTTITANGPEGKIGTVSVGKTLYGTITGQIGIGTIAANAIGGVINTSANIDNILVTGDLLPTANIRARKKINVLDILGDVETGATVTAASYGTKHIGGKNHGTITTA